MIEIFIENIEYQPPEYVRNESVDYRFDFWSLGILVYKLLTGSYPFMDCDAILNSEIPVLFFTNETKQFIKDLLAKTTDERLGSEKHSIKEHPFFQSILWTLLEKGDLTPQFKPNAVLINFILIMSHWLGRSYLIKLKRDNFLSL